MVTRHSGDGTVSDRAASWRTMAMFLGHWALRGHGQYVVEERATGRFAGRLGLWQPEGWPGLEIGWVITRDRWGHGDATEGARRVAAATFAVLGVDELISLIRPANVASVRVATKLGARRRRTMQLHGVPVDVSALPPPDLPPPDLPPPTGTHRGADPSNRGTNPSNRGTNPSNRGTNPSNRRPERP